MSASIKVVATPKGEGWECRVTVSERGSETRHTVSVTRAYFEKLAGAQASPERLPERLVEKSFEFLLAREPKESILRSFELTIISSYFSDYEQRIREML